MEELLKIDDMMKLPGAVVMKMCTLEENRSFCEQYKKEIYSGLIGRDFPRFYDPKSLKDPMRTYIGDLVDYGQPYTVPVEETDKKGLKIGKIAYLPILGEEYVKTPEKALTFWPNRLTFYLGPAIDFDEVTLKDYDKGSDYWIAGDWPSYYQSPSVYSPRVYHGERRAFSDAITCLNLFHVIVDFENKDIKSSFPYHYKKIRPGSVEIDVEKILKEEGSIYFVSPDGKVKTTFYVAKVYLEKIPEKKKSLEFITISTLPVIHLL